MFRELIYIKCAQCSAELLEFPGSDKLEGVRVTREGGAPGVLLFENHSDAIKVALSRDWQLGDVDLCVECAESRLAAVVTRENRTTEESSAVARVGLAGLAEREAFSSRKLDIELAPVDERDDPDAGISIGKGERVISGHDRQDGKTLIMLEEHGPQWIPEIEIHGDSEVYSRRIGASSRCGMYGEVIVSQRYAAARGWL